VGEHYELNGKTNRAGLYKCSDCREPFTVTVGTVFERSKIGLHIWLQAVYLINSSKKGISAKQLERTLRVTYKTAWFMAHRIREAMSGYGKRLLGSGGAPVEVDETYWGNVGKQALGARGYAHKMKVVSLVERNRSAQRTGDRLDAGGCVACMVCDHFGASGRSRKGRYAAAGFYSLTRTAHSEILGLFSWTSDALIMGACLHRGFEPRSGARPGRD